ncbi:pilus assembly protein [Marinobacter vinifirmus]|uniref:PilY1 beta-propeller domain-containing protein n=1 Tax=Marinobacter vinifirmus TaxID=355591 RepID=A0A558BHA4_9GAMM|nr:PilC/PilY family type IV pilus protein [Marinobacter vinifirmus]TVT35890.1 MAG: hypothetical protein FHK81_01355 [Marinobacter vinifirmus]
MKMKQFLKQVTQSLSVALFIGFPVAGWSATVSDRPLFIDSAVDHNLMFVVDDSGSMDFEVLAPKVGVAGAVSNGWLFNPRKENKTMERPYVYGLRMDDTRADLHPYNKMNYYLRSADYNLQYYDPSTEYRPWPSTPSNSFGNAKPSEALLDAGLEKSVTVDLQQAGALGLPSDVIPATFYVGLGEGTVSRSGLSCPADYQWSGASCRKCNLSVFGVCFSWDYEGPIQVAESQSCGAIKGNWYSDWHDKSSRLAYTFTNSSGATLDAGFAPDGSCIQKVELSSDHRSLVESITGDSLENQLQNFANWFSYYRKRHQAIRGAIAESVTDLEKMNLGVFWINDRRDMANKLYLPDKEYRLSEAVKTGRDIFLDEHYGKFGGGAWNSGNTPNRAALQHAGQQYNKTSVRGTLECKKNFTLLFTDGFSNNHPNKTDAGNADQAAGEPFQNSTHSDTLGDIAYYYYQGLRTNKKITPGGAMRLPVQCGTAAEKPWMDCNSDFHMNTYTVALGMEGQNFAGLTHSKVIDAHNNPPNWGSSSIGGSGNTAQIDDLYHAAVNGKGEYYDARSTTELIQALKSAIKDVQQQLGSGSNLSFNTTSLRSGGYIFAAEFMSQAWTGTLRAGAVDKDGNITDWVWDAAAVLNARDLTTDPRLILTYNNGAGTEFAWSDALNGAPKNDLKGGGTDTLGEARLDYIKGLDVQGSGDVTFKERLSRLGAIINSSPIYVGEPGFVWPDTSIFGDTAYSSFKSAKKTKTRQKVVYIGANDGMLHGFDAGTGDEVLAYIPGFLYSDEAGEGLSALTDPSAEYQSYVDLPLNMSDVFIDGEWKTVLIGGSRGATPGIFALDVTDPAEFSAANAADTVLWEFSGDPNLGNMTEAIQIALLDWGEGDYRWSAVFSNGYSSESDWKNGLFVVDIENPANYEFIQLGDGSGLSPARLVDFLDTNGDPNSDGIADRAYAGDLEGRLWAIDLTGGSENWGAAYGDKPLYVAEDSSNRVQPITAQPDVARNTFKSDLPDPNLLVFFGTGKYLEAGDIPQKENASDALPQSFYGINDRGTRLDASGSDLSRDDLTNRVVTTGTVSVEGENDRSVRKTDGAEMDWSSKYGWYVDLPLNGERVVESARVRGEYIVFTSTIPTGGDPCGGGGSSFVTALKLDGSTDADEAVIDVNNDGKLDDTDKGWAGFFYGGGIVTSFALIDDVLMTSDSGAKKQATLTNFGGGTNATGRIGWTELVDF